MSECSFNQSPNNQEDTSPKPQLDLAFKEGQTIKVNINIPKSDKAKARSKAGATGLLLPPPPGGAGAGNVKPPPRIENNNTVSFVGVERKLYL